MFYLFGVLLLGIVVLVHEFGHFIVARLCGVRVEVFSIGFGKALCKLKRGDTEYRISLVPLGGYVKMSGENPSEQEENEDKNIDPDLLFSHKKWWQKVCIVFAGPLFNILFTAVVLFVVSFFRLTAPSSLIEHVDPNGPAAAAGMVDGDIIVKMGNHEIKVWEDITPPLTELLENGECREIPVVVNRDGKLITLNVHPQTDTYKDDFGEEQVRCVLGVVRAPADATIVNLNNYPNLKNGDKILSVDGIEIDRFYKLKKLVEKPFREMKLIRDGKEMTVKFDQEGEFKKPELLHGGLIVSSVKKDGYTEKVGIRTGDAVLGINGIEITAPFKFYSEMKKLSSGDPVKLEILRDGERRNIDFTLESETKTDEMTGIASQRINWDAQFAFSYDVPEVMARRGNPVGYVFKYAATETAKMFLLTVKGFWYMISGKLSVKSVGGPIMIFDITKRAAELGADYFLYIMAVISINLGIINLMPIPVMDGGYVVIYTIEGIRRKSISPKLLQRLLTAGMVILFALMALAMTNDISRFFNVFNS
ncbi:RIP metalloprotease RseP [bacterium]|nr:RIP metalloprotease RseP [bacterium]